MERLDIIANSIKQNYYFKNENQKHNFMRVADKFKKEYSSLDNKNKEYAVYSTIDSLEDAHVLYSSMESIVYPINLKWFDDKLFVIGRENNIINIKKIQDKEIKDIIENYQLMHRSSPLSLIQSTIIRKILFGYYGDEFISSDDQILHFHDFEGVKLTPALMNEDTINTGCYMHVYQNCLYLRIYYFLRDSIIDYLLHILRSNHVKNIIIDLRGNLGGKTTLTKQVTSLFLSEPIKLNYIVRSNNEEYEQFVESNIVRKFESIYVLVDKNTRSSSEFIFLRALSLAYDNLTIIGEETFGLSGQVKQFVYPDCTISLTVRRYYDLNNNELEKGIYPKKHKVNDLNDFINNNDSQLMYTLELLNIKDDVKIYSRTST